MELLVARAIAVGQVERVNSVAAGSGQPCRHSPRQLGINEESHGSTG
jgi:hypothetical protein